MRASIIESTSARASGTLEKILEKPSEALGVVLASDEDILTALRQSSSRSRVLIVPTEADRNNYKSILGNVTIVTPEEAQGYQWDEVYAIVNPLLYPDPFTANQYLYTTFSRAKAFLMVSGINGNNAVSAELNSKLNQEDKILEANKKLYNDTIATAKKYQESFTGVPIITKEDLKQDTTLQPVEELDEQPIPVAEEDKEIQSPVIIPPPQDEPEVVTVPEPVITNPFEHSLRFPTNANITSVKVKETDGTTKLVSPIILGSTGHIIKVKTRSKDLYYVIAPHVTGG